MCAGLLDDICEVEMQQKKGALFINAVFLLGSSCPLLVPQVHNYLKCIITTTWTARALKSSLKSAKRLQLDWTKTEKDQTCSLGLSVLRSEDCKKTNCGGPVLLVKTGILYSSNNLSKRT